MSELPPAPSPIEVPQTGLKVSWGLGFVGCLAALICMSAAILVPILKSAGASMESQQCSGNLRRLARALILYSEDNSGLLPAQGWNGDLLKYEPDPVTFACPHQRRMDPRSSGYALNKSLARTSLKDVKDAAQVPLVFDSLATAPSALAAPGETPRPGRHRNGRMNNVAYADGRVAPDPVN